MKALEYTITFNFQEKNFERKSEFKKGDKVVVVSESGYVYGSGLYTFHSETESAYIILSPYSKNNQDFLCYAKCGQGLKNGVRLEKVDV